MNKNDLEIVKCALLQAKSAEMASVVPDSMIEYNFSEKFEKEMNALIEKMRQKTIGFNKRTIAILIAAVILVSLLFTLAVAGEELYNFFVNITGQETVFFTPQNEENPSSIVVEYYPQYIPDGFEIVSETSNIGKIKYKYSSNETEITFCQMVANNSSHGMNTEDAERHTISIGDCAVHYVYMEQFNAYDFLWFEHGYMFSLLCVGDIDFEEAVKIIENVEEK